MNVKTVAPHTVDPLPTPLIPSTQPPILMISDYTVYHVCNDHLVIYRMTSIKAGALYKQVLFSLNLRNDGLIMVYILI
jgi:hypothetical protein